MWDALSAIGTMLAVIVALGLALWSSFQKQSGDKKKSGMVAARLLETVMLLTEETRRKMAIFAFYEDDRNSADDGFADQVLTLRRLVESINVDTIHALAPLPRHCANRLAMALGIIDALGSEIEYAKSQQPWSQMTPPLRRHYIARWFSLTSSAADYLHTVKQELELAAGVSAPRPSAEEIHGP